jgi:predicted transcriptional regulator of viral defense system
MPIIKYNQIIKKTFQKPIFTVEDLSNQGIPRNYAKKILHESQKKGKTTRIERGKYTTTDDPIIIATHLTEPCYLSMWSALNIRGLNTQIPFSIEIITTRKRFNRKINFKNTPIIFYTIKPEMMYGYEQIIWKENIRIPIATPEKIIIDALYFRTIPLDELKDTLNNINKKKLLNYAKLTKKTHIINTIKRLTKC